MKVKDRSNYKPGSQKDECASPPYAVVPLLDFLDDKRSHLLDISRKDFIIWEPATGLDMSLRPKFGLCEGFERFGYRVHKTFGEDFLNANIDDVNEECYKLYGSTVKLIATNPPYQTKLKRQFFDQCWYMQQVSGVSWALLVSLQTISEIKLQHHLVKSSVHIPHGRINYGMPNKGWGTKDDPTKATFSTCWITNGLGEPGRVYYDDFKMSNHFEALNDFNVSKI